MEGIYLTEEGKQEIENKITELKKEILSDLNNKLIHYVNVNNVEIYVLRDILESAIILPVESSENFNLEKVFEYKKGIIIKPPIEENDISNKL